MTLSSAFASLRSIVSKPLGKPAVGRQEQCSLALSRQERSAITLGIALLLRKTKLKGRSLSHKQNEVLIPGSQPGQWPMLAHHDMPPFTGDGR
jgi:hypothetical protein